MTETKVTSIITVAILLPCLATMALALRIYVRIGLQQTFQLQDYCIVISWLCYIPSSVFTILASTKGGIGHIEALTYAQDVASFKWFLFASLTYIMSVSFFKNSIALLEIRLGGARWYRVTLWASIAVNFVSTFFLFFYLLFQCKPVSHFWNRLSPGTCPQTHVTNDLILFFGLEDILFDWMYALLPIPLIWSLQMNIRNKISVILLLGLGVLASVATIVRFASLRTMRNATGTAKAYAYADFMIWSNVEIGLGIITACVSMMRPLLRRMNILISEYGQPTSRNAQSMTWKSGPSSKRTTFQSRSHEYGSQLEDLPTLPRKPRAIVVRNSVEITSSHMRQMQSSSQESILAPHYHARYVLEDVVNGPRV